MKNLVGIILFVSVLSTGLISCDYSPRTSGVTPTTGNAPLLQLDPPSAYRQLPARPMAPVANSVPASASTTNPAHGQPGHRCDIAVGAPIPSANPPVAAAPKLNPKHGEPGHRCDIAVGAPLTAAAGQPAATTAVAPTSSPANVVSTQAATPAESGTVKLNPKHGEPGHRCDIAVGAPLK